MNTTQLSRYAPEARRAFIAAVSAEAARLGIGPAGIAEAQVQGDLLLVGGQAFPKAIAPARGSLVRRVRAHGYAATMEAVAYTWFNRLVAIRYMELHGYLDHGYRVLSHPTGQPRPEILDHAAEVELPGLDRDRAIGLKLDGTRDEELYRLLLTAQCNALHRAMPFLFEEIGDETELLLPANLLHTDSLIRQLVAEVGEEQWREIEIIGWLYQFYISEKKDQVMGAAVASEDIPAATQLFTPNWIVKYLVQNSLGAQWLATHPQAPLRARLEYYVEPAEQTDEVKAQLAAITPSQLDPEELTLIDPACGSGHILVEAYDLFKAIYLERGYRQRDVARLILEKNLYGLDIDERAAQLTGFALMMKGRADDRKLFHRHVRLNVMAFVGSESFDAAGLARAVDLAAYELTPSDLSDLKDSFQGASTFGSLLRVKEGVARALPGLRALSAQSSDDLFVSDALERMRPLVRQAALLAARYDAVVANPPYMGRGGMNAALKKFTSDAYPEAKTDLFACFIERSAGLAKPTGRSALITMQNWMFLTRLEKLRDRLLRERTIGTMAHLGARAFRSIGGEVVQTTAFTLRGPHLRGYRPVFFRLLEGGEDDKRSTFLAGRTRFDTATQDEFREIPGSPIAYWVSPAVYEAFRAKAPIGKMAKKGLICGDTERFYRAFWEVDVSRCSFAGGTAWFPINKGGPFRKWYGNRELLINWENDGAAIKGQTTAGSNTHGAVGNEAFFFRECASWNDVATGALACRYTPEGAIPTDSGSGLYSDSELMTGLSFLNSPAAAPFAELLCPTIHFGVGQIAKFPLARDLEAACEGRARELIELFRSDWDSYERSWDFRRSPLLGDEAARSSLAASYEAARERWSAAIARAKRLEEENARLFVDAYGFESEVSADVPVETVTLTVNPHHRYRGNLTDEERASRMRQDTVKELISYAVGCMMGRYSLDAPGLIYAHAGNEGFDRGRYLSFPADDDGIVPVTDTDWFADDACHRLVEFVSVAWDAAHLEDNLAFLAAPLQPKRNEDSRDTLRRYLCDGFFRDHLQTYKKRPIYWLFTSGRQEAFQCLVYLHRYNEGTLSRMRNEYVIPLQGKMTARLEKLAGDLLAATSTAHGKRLEKERAKLVKQEAELLAFDEKLRHHADMRIALDLDDGVKVNYGKFGDLLADVKAVNGGHGELV